VVSLDRLPVSHDGRVLCPLRDARVNVAECLACPQLARVGGADPPAYIVCEARQIVGWLGMDSPA
jgi:hypothetical protein